MSNVWIDRSGQVYTADVALHTSDQQVPFPSPDFLNVLSTSPQELSVAHDAFISAQQESGNLDASDGWIRSLVIFLFFLGTLAFSFLSFSGEVKALEAECFIQASGSTPVPCPVDAYGNPITASSTTRKTTINCGACTITVGGTFQVLSFASDTRNAFEVQNTNTNGDLCYLHIGSDSATLLNSIILLPFRAYSRTTGVVPADQLQFTCPTTNDTFILSIQ